MRRLLRYGLLGLFGMLCGSPVFAEEWKPLRQVELGTIADKAKAWEIDAHQGDKEVKITCIIFHERDLKIFVKENSQSAPRKLREMAPSVGAVAGCNASYFHRDGEPLGLVVSEGEELHHQERAKLLSGILAVRNGRPELVRASEFRPGNEVTQAVQAGPWLVSGGRVSAGLESTKRARRTVLATDGRGNWAFISTSPVTLADAADLLESPTIFPGFGLREALNMDGGSSTALWARTGSGEISIPEIGTVRNFLLLRPR